jgi:hypothetical protein
MQNIDVGRVLASGQLVMPYPIETRLGHVDMADLSECAAKVALEPGHSFASYDVAADQHLSVVDICEVITRLSGKTITPGAITPDQLVPAIAKHWDGPLSRYSIGAFHRLFGYYARHGISGNPNVLRWLLGREPTSFDSYVSRVLAGESRPAGNIGL